MKKFEVGLSFAYSWNEVVEAETEEEAAKLAEGNFNSFCDTQEGRSNIVCDLQGNGRWAEELVEEYQGKVSA